MNTTEFSKRYKVFIPTAGIGSRLNNLTKYLNKSLVSIQNKPIISKIIDMFPQETEFVIGLGYKGELVKDFLQLAYPEKTFYFATVDKYEGEESGLGLTMFTCENFLKEPFVFCSCDTLVKETIPYPSKNIVGFAERENKKEYRTIEIKNNKVIKFYEKEQHTITSKPYIGIACIYDWELFWKEMHSNENLAIKLGESYALQKFAQNGILHTNKFTWFDTGNEVELEKTKEYFLEENEPNILTKENEAIWFVNNKVIKFSNDKNFIKNRVTRSKYLKDYIPTITSYTDNMYCYNKEEGMVLSQITNIVLLKKLLKHSNKFWETKQLNKEEKKAFYNTCRDFYYKKTIDRINLYLKKHQIEDSETIINNLKIPTIKELLKLIDWENIFNGLSGQFHGDFHFENILYNKSKNKFIFLDWRQGFGNSLTVGDIYYDFAKLLHGFIICHELIAQNKYDIKINKNIINYTFERKDILIECENYFYEWLKEQNYDVEKVKILTALIFLNIAGLHHYPYCHLLYNLGKQMLYEILI